MDKLTEALKLAREAEKAYTNDWNGLKVKAVREKLEEALADSMADRAIETIAMLDGVKR